MKKRLKTSFVVFTIFIAFLLISCDNNYKTQNTTKPQTTTTNQNNNTKAPTSVTSITTSRETKDQTIETTNQTVDTEAEKLKEQLGILESTIENQIKEKLNFRFDDEIVLSIDIKYFDFEQDKQYNTTFFACGTLILVDDENEYSFRLGMPLEGEDFSNVSPLYYVEIDETKDLAENYSIDNLTAVNSYFENPEITFSKATLNGQNWNLDILTSAKIERVLEEKCENLFNRWFHFSTDYFLEEVIKDVDFRIVTVVNDADYGYLLKLNGFCIVVEKNWDCPYIFETSFEIDKNIFDLFTENYMFTENKTGEFMGGGVGSSTDYQRIQKFIFGKSTADSTMDLNLKDNYTNELLNKINEIIQDKIYAKVFFLDGQTFEGGTSYKIEKVLEDKYRRRMHSVLQESYPTTYLYRFNACYFSIEYDAVHGYLLNLWGDCLIQEKKENNMYDNGTHYLSSVSFKITEKDYNDLENNILTGDYAKNRDLKDNYTNEQLIKVLAIIMSKETSVKCYNTFGKQFVF